MRILRKILPVLLLAVTCAAHAVDKDVQIDLLMAKIVALVEAQRPAEALPYFAQIEGLGVPLSENLQFLYIDTLDRAGEKGNALKQANTYVEKYGRKGKNYGPVIEIMSRLQIQADKESRERAIAKAATDARAAAEAKTAAEASAAREIKAARATAFEGGMIPIRGKNYAMGKYEVTQGLWREVMGSNPSNFSTCGDNCPVDSVSWKDVQEFILKLNARLGTQYRLPTEAEWDYACQGGSQHNYCGGDRPDVVGWVGANSNQQTHLVGQKPANAYGLHDMIGNVGEWTQDYFSEKWKGVSRETRVTCGGSWIDSKIPTSDNPCETVIKPTDRRGNVGFRLARTLP